MRKVRGFTLVELLVVIGIIALLISILLPSLARARQSAVNIQCMSNLRSVGQGLLLYANDHKGKLPFSASGLWLDIWPAQVTLMLGGQLTDLNNANRDFSGRYAPVLRCPEVQGEWAELAWGTGGFHYTANCRAMPTQGSMGDPVHSGGSVPYPLNTKDAASKMLLWDGPVQMGFGYMAPTNNQEQAWWYVSWGPGGSNFSDPPYYAFNGMDTIMPPAIDTAYNSTNPSSANWVGHCNRDGNETENRWSWRSVGYQRYRHMGNTSGNFLFFDGHVEPRKVGTVTVRELSIYPF